MECCCAQLGRSDVYGFIDPFHIQGENDPAGSRSHMTKKLLEDNKHCYLAPYLRKYVYLTFRVFFVIVNKIY